MVEKAESKISAFIMSNNRINSLSNLVVTCKNGSKIESQVTGQNARVY